MAKISTYDEGSTPQLGDKLLGTSLAGPPSNNTNNFVLQAILNLFQPEITLQKVTQAGNITTLSIAANSFIKTGGSSAQFLKANGSVDNNLYALDNNVVHKTGDELIGGTKTFTNTPIFYSGNIEIKDNFYPLTRGDIRFTKDRFIITNGKGKQILSAQESRLEYQKNDTIGAVLAFDNLLEDQSYMFPNASGTIALEETVKPYKVYTALLTQSGNSDELYVYVGQPTTIGVTYTITANENILADFTNIGAPNNTVGTIFIATGTTPASWGTDAELTYTAGAPVATVLENTIGNIWFTYNAVGVYLINSNGLFTIDKSWTPTIQIFNDTAGLRDGEICEIRQGNSDQYLVATFENSGAGVDGRLTNTPIEIRVYN